MPKASVVALLVADLHLSHRCPTARLAEESWYAAMGRQVVQLATLAKGWGAGGKELPVVCAGDVFDRWNEPAECINWALRHLPPMYAVPGQHDLPHHDLGAVRRSAYWTLVEAGKLTHLKPGRPVQLEVGGRPLRLHGFPWGVPVQPLKRPHDLAVEVAVVHAYLWRAGKGHSGASLADRVNAVRGAWEGYDLAVYGDNHIPFEASVCGGSQAVYNAGSFLRRKADEIGHRPSVGLLRADNTVERHYLDVSEDKFVDAEELVKGCLTGAELLDLVEELGGLQHRPADFRDAVLRAAGKLPPGVRAAVHRALEEADR